MGTASANADLELMEAESSLISRQTPSSSQMDTENYLIAQPKNINPKAYGRSRDMDVHAGLSEDHPPDRLA